MSDNLKKDDGFYLMANGQVESCEMQGEDHLYCRYSFVYGKPDWSYAHGVEHGMSQIAVNGQGPESLFVWNYPIDITLRSTNVHGWPQIVFSVYGVNWFGDAVIKGYASTFLPTVPGRHVRYVRMYAPVSSSLCQQFTAWLTCTPPEFFETNFIAQGKGREVTRVRSNGCIKVVFNITTKNMNDWGYQNSKERVDPTENFDRQQTQFFAKGPQSGPQMNASMRSRSKKERLSTLEKEKRLQKKKRPSARDRSDSEDMYGDGFKKGEGYSSSASKQRRGDRAEPGSSLKHRVSGRNRRDDSDLDSFGGVGDHKMATGEFSKRSSSKKGRRDY